MTAKGQKYCYLNGRIMPVGEAALSVDDIGVLRGYGVFDYLRTYNGRPFLLKEHLARFWRSARALSLQIPVSQKRLAFIVSKLLVKNKLPESAIRIVLTGGATKDGMSRGRSPTLLVLIEKLHTPPRSWYEKGIALMSYEYDRVVPEAKTTNYITAVRLQHTQRKHGASEILYTSRELVREATTSNFFLFLGDTLVTPHKDVLIGTTRNFVMKLARKSFKIEERDIRMREIRGADEAFITATNKEIVPVVRVDAIKIGTGKVGERTKKLMKLFHKYKIHH